MTPEDSRFLRKVYEKAERIREKRRRAMLTACWALCAVLLGIVAICQPGDIVLYCFVGAALLSSMLALQWTDLKAQ